MEEQELRSWISDVPDGMMCQNLGICNWLGAYTGIEVPRIMRQRKSALGPSGGVFHTIMSSGTVTAIYTTFDSTT